MEIEKLRVNKEVAAAIEAIKRFDSDYATLVSSHVNTKKNNTSWTHEAHKSLNDLSIDEFIRALYVGYEIEQTPKDIAKELYEHFLNNACDLKIPYPDRRFATGYYQAIEKMNELFELGLELEGHDNE
ncbi:hypothetical protein SFC08_13240 [Lysinibacillus halotolerans]